MTGSTDSLEVGATVAYEGPAARTLDGAVTPCEVAGSFVVVATVGDTVTLRDARHVAGDFGDDALDAHHTYDVARSAYSDYASAHTG